MHKPNRGLASERLVRLFVPVWLLLFGACTSRGTLTVPQQRGTEPMTSPAGCVETVCDYFFSLCADPCDECWDSCGREDDQVSVIKCSQQCTQLCSAETKPTPLAQCAAERTACRSTMRNTICIDGMRDDMPRG